MGQARVLCAGSVALLLLAGIGCAGSDGGGELREVNFTELLGTWTFQIQSNPSCPGPGPSGALVLQVHQSATDVSLLGLGLDNATSTWSIGGQSGGYVTGWLSLSIPGIAWINLVAGDPVDGGAPSPARVATLNGTVTADLGFSGTLSDPTLAQGHQPIFSTACVYQVTGQHD
jgi:hypothetical protein